MKEAMQLDATLQLPDGKQIPVVVELDATQLETSLADTGLADVVARAVEVLGSRPRALAWLRTPVGGLDGKTPLEAMAGGGRYGRFGGPRRRSAGLETAGLGLVAYPGGRTGRQNSPRSDGCGGRPSAGGRYPGRS